MLSIFVTGFISLSCQLQGDMVLTYQQDYWQVEFSCDDTLRFIQSDMLIYDTMLESVDMSSLDINIFQDGFE